MKVLAYIATAVLAIGITGCKDDATSSNTPSKTPGEKAGDAVQTAVNVTTRESKEAKDAVVASVTPSGSSDISGMRGTLEGVIQNALDADDFKSMTGHLTDADKKRLETTNLQSINADIEKFKQKWKDKYGGDVFTVMDAEKIYANDFVELKSNATSGAGDTKVNTGTATVKASHGMPEVQVPMVAQDGKWRMDLPDEVDAMTAQQNLQKAVQDINGMSGEWPEDKVQAYRQVSHRILMALTNTQSK